MSEASPRLEVGVVVERVRAASRWADFIWRPVMVLSQRPDAQSWTVLQSDAQRALFYAGAAEVALHRSAAPQYRDNLCSGTPGLWVVLQATGADPPYAVAAVTADPSEAEALAETTSIVEQVPMPKAIHEIVTAFVAGHGAEPPFEKRRRDRADAEALARRTPSESRKWPS